MVITTNYNEVFVDWVGVDYREGAGESGVKIFLFGVIWLNRFNKKIWLNILHAIPHASFIPVTQL